MNHRTRKIPVEGGSWLSELRSKFTDLDQAKYNTDSVIKQDNSYIVPTYLMGGQITDSESHPQWLRRRKGRYHGDLGGPFFSQKWWVELSDSSPRSVGWTVRSEPSPAYPSGRYITSKFYSGPMLPCSPSYFQWPGWSRSSDDDLDELGTTAIARCSPSNPSVDLATAIGELLREGIPKAIGGTLSNLGSLSARDRRRAVGDEYLNYEFGWKPLVNDLSDFCRTIVSADLIWNQYQRDSGLVVRRAYDFPVQKVTNVKTFLTGVSPWWSPSTGFLTDPNTTLRGQVLRTEESVRRQWFRGAFTYYVPPADSLRNELARAVIQARKVLGVSLTPDTLWNLAPWSWGVDWFSHTGDLLSNWTDWAIDNQVLLYGYMMEETTIKWTYTFVGHTGFAGGATPPPSVSFITRYQIRRKATPYGFGLRWEDFSPRQSAILAALGITKSR